MRITALLMLLAGVLVCVFAVLGLIAGLINLAAGGWLLVILFGTVLLLGVTLLFFAIRSMRTPKPLRATSNAPQGKHGNYVANEPEPRQHNGQSYEVQFQPAVGGKNPRPSSLVVRVAAATPTTLQFNEETWFDRFCKGFGIAREHQTGDIDFDEAVYVRGPSFEYAEQYLENEDKREAIRVLIKEGFREVRLTGTSIEAVWQRFNPAVDDRPGLPGSAAEQLFVLAAKLPKIDLDPAVAGPEPGYFPEACLWTLEILFALTVVFAFVYPPIRVLALLSTGLTAFLVVYPLFGLIAGVMLHGRSTSHDRWGRLMGWAVVLIAVGSVGTVAMLNTLGDSGPPEVRALTVSSKRTAVSGRNRSRHYYASVPDWDRPGETLEFSMSSEEYGMVTAGRTQLELTTGRGWLGIEWLRSKRVRQ